MKCVFCFAKNKEYKETDFVYDGYSLCIEHAIEYANEKGDAYKEALEKKRKRWNIK